jgi:hypothetical protein
MALKGTLKDFGIAEILQLIGQQMKSGVLHLESRDEEVHIALAEGSIVRAEAVGRKAKERLGAMLVRAEIITQDELDYALNLQRRSLRRLGDLLVESGFVSREDLREITGLQTTETIYQLFHWKSGTYEFEAGAVEWDKETSTPLRAESVLMEGFRRVDEWPIVRKKLPSLHATFQRKRALEPERTPGLEEDDELLGPNERRVYLLAVPGRTAEKVVDLSRLGEFETCKALANLVNRGYLALVASAGRAAAVGEYAHSWQARLRAGAARALVTVVVAAALGALLLWLDRRALAARGSGVVIRDDAPRRYLSRHHQDRLRGALEVYRAERGEYPAALSALVESGLVKGDDLRGPWREPFYYRRADDGGFVLLPPVE